MRVFIISCVFPPEPVTTATTSADLAEEMMKRGHEVTVFTSFPNRPAGNLISGYTRRLKQVEYKDGYKVVRSFHTFSKTSKIVSRVAENISFGLTSTYQILRLKPPGVVYMNTWPLFSQGLNSWLFKRLGVPIICSVQDIFPESLGGKGIFKLDGWISQMIRSVDCLHLRRCSILTSISPSMVELLVKDRGLPTEKVRLFPNWMDASIFSPNLPQNGSFRNELKIKPGVFLAIFAGSLTMAAGIDLYVKVAEMLSSRRDICILLVGDGSMRKKIENDISFLQLTNIRVVYPLRTERVPEVQAAADVLLMSLSGEMLQSALPSKQIAYMFSGRPIIASISAENTAAKILVEANAGFVLPPDDPNAIANLLLELADNRTPLQQLGNNARKYAKDNFSKEIVMPRLANLLESVSKSK